MHAREQVPHSLGVLHVRTAWYLPDYGVRNRKCLLDCRMRSGKAFEKGGARSCGHFAAHTQSHMHAWEISMCRLRSLGGPAWHRCVHVVRVAKAGLV